MIKYELRELYSGYYNTFTDYGTACEELERLQQRHPNSKFYLVDIYD